MLAAHANSASPHPAAPTILVFGDSLSAAYGLPPDAGWVSLLQKRLHQQSPSYRLVNASISGETTLGGRNRIAGALKTHRPNIVIIELGGNDGLRGAPPDTVRDNLAAIIIACKKNNAEVVLTGMRLPPNYGIAYTQKFQAIYPQLAKQHRVKLVPFLLEGFSDRPEFFQADGIHPTATAQEKIVANVWKVLQGMLV